MNGIDALIWQNVAAEAAMAVYAVVIAEGDGGEILYMSELAEGMFGYDKGEMVGRCVDELLPEDARGRHKAYRASFAANPRARPMGHGMVLFGFRKDGSLFPVQISLSPVRAMDRDVVVAFVVDLSGAVNTASRIKSAVDSGVIS